MANRPMKTKSQIVDNWLVRYTGLELESFGEYILLTNFDKYVNIFAEKSLGGKGHRPDLETLTGGKKFRRGLTFVTKKVGFFFEGFP